MGSGAIEHGGVIGDYGPPVMMMDPPPVTGRVVQPSPSVAGIGGAVVASTPHALHRSWVSLNPPPLPQPLLAVGL